MKIKPLKLLDATITHFSKEGDGIGEGIRADGQPVEVVVPFAVPGDLLRVALLKRKKGLYQARFQEEIKPAADRIVPRCLHFGACGGCRWQSVPYEKQLAYKEQAIYQLFSPFLSPDTLIHPIIPCSPPWSYRNKMELSFSSDKKGNRYLGLILQGTRGHVFQMEECHLANPWMAETVAVVSHWWEEQKIEAYYCGRNEGSLRTLTLREGMRTGDRMVILTVSGNPDYALNKEQLDAFVKGLVESIKPKESEGTLSVVLRIQQIAKGHPTQFYEMILFGSDHIREILYFKNSKGEQQPLHFQISPTAFFQPNTLQAEKLYSRAIELTGISSEDVVYDLYCGTATLGIYIANTAKKVVGIEIVPESVLDGRENIKRNHLSTIEIFQGDVGKILPEVLKSVPPDVVMIDPPRSGLDTKALNYLLEMKAPKLTYISCNPSTQAVNLEALIKGGYRLTSIQSVDQFPHTAHVENIVTLTL